MSDATAVKVLIGEESSFGASPTAGNYDVLRITDESLKQTTEVSKSAEIVSDAQITEAIRTGFQAQGATNHELSYSVAGGAGHLGFEKLLAAGIRSADFGAVSAPITSTISVTDNETIADSGSGLGGLTVGDWILITGSANEENNGARRVNSVLAGSIVVEGAGLVVESSGSMSLYFGVSISNGTTARSFTIERQNTDTSPATFARWNGMTVGGFTIGVTADGIVTISFDWLGKGEVLSGSARPTSTIDGSPTAAPTTQVFNAVDHVTGIFEGGSPAEMVSFNLELNNGLRPRKVIGTQGLHSVGKSVFDIQAQFTALWENSIVMNKYLSFTDSSLAIAFQDDAGNGYVAELLNVKYDDGENLTPGQDQDVLGSFNAMCTKEATSGKTIKIWKFT